VDALTQTITGPDFQFRNERALLILAEMNSIGSLATDSYIERCIDLAWKSLEFRNWLRSHLNLNGYSRPGQVK
jgi:hypothetical protein